jgi:hypothetical protein
MIWDQRQWLHKLSPKRCTLLFTHLSIMYIMS